MYKLWKKGYSYRKKDIKKEERRDSLPRVQNREKKAIVELKSSSKTHRGKSILGQHIE